MGFDKCTVTCIHHYGIIQSSFFALKILGFEVLGKVPSESEADHKCQPPLVSPVLQMGLVCPLVVGAMISVTSREFLRNTARGQQQTRQPLLAQSSKQEGASNPRKIRAEGALPWEAGHLALLLDPLCLLGDLEQDTLPLWAELLEHMVG